MGRKMKLPFLSKINNTTTSKSSWPCPAYCQQPRTLSFRTGDNMFKTINSTFLDATIRVVDTTPVESCFTNSSSQPVSSSTATDEDSGNGETVENVIKGLRSERLFFEPGETSSILEEAKANEFPFKESSVLSMESQDPYMDFKKSMEEMVEAHAVKDWKGLEELLCCYLKVNGKRNYGYIIGAFVDLLVGLGLANLESSSSSSSLCSSSSRTQDSCSCSCSHDFQSPTSPLFFYTSNSSSCCTDDSSSSVVPCVSSLEAEEEEAGITPCPSSLEGEKEIQEN